MPTVGVIGDGNVFTIARFVSMVGMKDIEARFYFFIREGKFEAIRSSARKEPTVVVIDHDGGGVATELWELGPCVITWPEIAARLFPNRHFKL